MRAPVADPRSFSAAEHLGFDGTPHRPKMGVRKVEAGGWLEPDANRAWQLEHKAALIDADRDRHVQPAASPAAERGVARLAALLSDEVGRDARSGALLDEAALDEAARTGSGAGAIEACGLATQEDWCVMVREDAWRLRAACVCFPSRWVLAHKQGATVAEIHGPVDRYEQELGGVVESFFDRLPADRTVWRLNWNLWDDPSLSQSFPDAEAVEFDLPPAAEVGERVFLRVERQTLRRVTDDAIAFSIRVHQRPLSALAGQEGAIALLRSTLGGPEGAALTPKKLGRLAPPVLTWLDTVA